MKYPNLKINIFFFETTNCLKTLYINSFTKKNNKQLKTIKTNIVKKSLFIIILCLTLRFLLNYHQHRIYCIFHHHS